MSSRARKTFLFALSSCQVRPCFPTGQATHVLDKPAEVVSTWSVGHDLTDGLQQTGTEDIFNWLNMDALDHLIEWHDTEPSQVPSHQAHHSRQERELLSPLLPPFGEFGLEGPVHFSGVPGIVPHEGHDVHQPSPMHSHHSPHKQDQALISGNLFNLQPGKSRKLEENIQSKHQATESSLQPTQMSHTGPSHYQCLPNGPFNLLNSDQGLASSAQLEQHMNPIQDKTLDRKREDVEWQFKLVKSLMYVPMRHLENPLLTRYLNRLQQRYELLPHALTKSFKGGRIGFGKLPVQVVKELGLVRPTDQKNNEPIRKERFLCHMRNLINWITFISKLPKRKPGTGTVECTVPTEVMDWLIEEIFEPNGSLPVLGVAGELTYYMDETAFGDLQKLLINFFSEGFSKENCISLCLSILKFFPNTGHHDLDFIYNMPKPEPGSQSLTKDQFMMKAIHSFQWQKRILFNIRPNTKVPGLEGKRKAQNPINVNKKIKIQKS
ncbi:hypothetical protein PSTG_10053 [Puccinia striiformis f. sp. tritici PST-78]|uniref:Uncharacterized protein n=1 Tax=Puccinia striiformis f. sp. tritici PST-78 TaxID=1165861 RepID=A0A0L0VBR7_9BASI|nr:hypothetical protein PSTG_10053 [Puccinia striiformis f. sp. tritici PST-78]